MSSFNSGFGWNGFGRGQPAQAVDYGVADSTMATFFNAVFGWMAAGLGVTALVAYMVARNIQAVAPIFSGPGLIMLVIAELALVWVVSAAVNKISAGVAAALFLLYAALNGLMFSTLFFMYSTQSLAGAFLVTAGMFGAMCVYGAVTRRNLVSMQGFFMMALIGIILATVVNFFIGSSMLYWGITYLGVLLFCGLTAFDVQRLKQDAFATAGDGAVAARYAVRGALRLYLDFINLFLYILRILASNSRRR